MTVLPYEVTSFPCLPVNQLCVFMFSESEGFICTVSSMSVVLCNRGTILALRRGDLLQTGETSPGGTA